ncbi:MAG: NTP transferase domain-containing protein [Chloroflexales bacterium]|nr:NTP transferase domain-containing protein [Chloroflexales bacterium]
MAPTSAAAACATRHAVILVAGESKRTRPLTLHRPKPLIPLLDRPLLAHILDELVGLVERVTLVVGYRADMIEAAFGTAYRGIGLRYARQTVVNGTAGALLAAGKIDEPFFLLYGDNLIAREDVLGVCGGRYGVAGLRVEDARSFGILEIQGDTVCGILEKPASPPPDALANPGIYQLDAAVFPLLERIRPSPRGELELTDLIGAIAATDPVRPHVCTGHWVPVGTPWEALGAAQFLLARRPGGPVFIHPEASVHPEARVVGPASVGAGCSVGAGAVVEASVLVAGASVGAGARVHASWLDEGARVGAGAVLAARPFEEPRPTAETRGLLSRAQLITRGVVLGQGAEVPAETSVEPGTVIVGGP